jgi:adenine-specific DNA-methyltransferase
MVNFSPKTGSYFFPVIYREIKVLCNNTIYRVTDPDKEQSFTICLDNTLHPETLQALNLTKDDLFICRDVALDDEAAANLALQCRLKTI